MRNCAANVKSSLKNNFEVQGVVKPGAVANILVNSAKNEVKGLSKRDIVIICGGANDIGRNDTSSALHQIMDFVANNKHTNIALITAPPRHDLIQSSCVNDAVNCFNRKLKKLIKAHHHATLLEIDPNRNFYTNHSLHLNGQGKEKLANKLVSHIHSALK
jgi:lysophospholipase L1-like esterase